MRLQWTLTYLSILKHLLNTPNFLPNLYQCKPFMLSKKMKMKNSSTNTNSLNPLYNDFMKSEFKLNYKQPSLIRSPSKLRPYKPIIDEADLSKIRLMRSFKSYIRLNVNSFDTINIPHFSFKHFYLRYRRGGVNVLNISKFFSRWKDVYYLVYNIFFYRMDMLVFGTSFFKRELLAFNWQSMQSLKFMWRYTRPFIALRPNKITTYGDFVFYRLNLLGMRLGFVIDVLYHNKTIYYLHRNGFYTIGLVPINYNINTLNFVIPSSSDSLTAQIFLIRFMSLIKQNTQQTAYNSMKLLWNSK